MFVSFYFFESWQPNAPKVQFDIEEFLWSAGMSSMQYALNSGVLHWICEIQLQGIDIMMEKDAFVLGRDPVSTFKDSECRLLHQYSMCSFILASELANCRWKWL